MYYIKKAFIFIFRAIVFIILAGIGIYVFFFFLDKINALTVTTTTDEVCKILLIGIGFYVWLNGGKWALILWKEFLKATSLRRQ